MASYNSDADRARDAIGDLESYIKELEKRVGELEKENEKLQDTISARDEEIVELIDERDDYQTLLDASERENDKLKQIYQLY